MIDITWNVFRKTGDIETYLLLKQIEEEALKKEEKQTLQIKDNNDSCI